VGFLRKNKIGFLVATDDVRYRTMLLNLFNQKVQADRFAKMQFRPCDAPYLAFAMDRLACLNHPVLGLNRLKTFVFSADPMHLIRRAVVYQVLYEP